MADFPTLSDEADVTVLAQAVKDYVGKRVQAGLETGITLPANTTVTVPVVFPVEFDSQPAVTADLIVSDAALVNREWGLGAITSKGFNFYARSSTSVTLQAFTWQAVAIA